MATDAPILIAGAGGQVGSVGPALAKMLRQRGRRVRALVRAEDERSQRLRQTGAEIVVGDLLNAADVAAAARGCRRFYFSMSLNPYYADANILMGAVARAQGDAELFVNISEFEQSYMTADRMSLPRQQRLEWLGGLVADWSPQQRAHWVTEQALDWSGLPVVHVRATLFVENPLLCWLPARDIAERGELRLPFGDKKLAPVAAYDVAEFCANLLAARTPAQPHAYELTGPELKDMHGFARDYAAALHRPVTYVPQPIETWNVQYIEFPFAARIGAHTSEHLKTLTRLIAGGRYEVITDQLEPVLGRPPKTLRWAIEQMAWRFAPAKA